MPFQAQKEQFIPSGTEFRHLMYKCDGVLVFVVPVLLTFALLRSQLAQRYSTVHAPIKYNIKPDKIKKGNISFSTHIRMKIGLTLN